MEQLYLRGGRGGGGDITAAKPQPVQATFSQTPPVHMLPVDFFYTFLLFLLQNHALFKLLFLENHHMLPWSLFTKLPTKLMEYIM